MHVKTAKNGVGKPGIERWTQYVWTRASIVLFEITRRATSGKWGYSIFVFTVIFWKITTFRRHFVTRAFRCNPRRILPQLSLSSNSGPLVSPPRRLYVFFTHMSSRGDEKMKIRNCQVTAVHGAIQNLPTERVLKCLGSEGRVWPVVVVQWAHSPPFVLNRIQLQFTFNFRSPDVSVHQSIDKHKWQFFLTNKKTIKYFCTGNKSCPVLPRPWSRTG